MYILLRWTGFRSQDTINLVKFLLYFMFSVLTPYYREDVLYSVDDLHKENEDGITTLFYLQKIYPGEFYIHIFYTITAIIPVDIKLFHCLLSLKRWMEKLWGADQRYQTLCWQRQVRFRSSLGILQGPDTCKDRSDNKYILRWI